MVSLIIMASSETSEIKGSLLLAWQVKDKHCLVIGSGDDVALSRIHHLIKAQAKITVVTGASKIHPQIIELNNQGNYIIFSKEIINLMI